MPCSLFKSILYTTVFTRHTRYNLSVNTDISIVITTDVNRLTLHLVCKLNTQNKGKRNISTS